MRRRWVAGLVAAGAGIAGLLLWPLITTLEIRDSRGNAVFCARVRPGEELVLSFIHSVNKRPVFDTLRAEADHLVIVKSRFDSFGAGMPDTSTDEGTLRPAADGWLEWTTHRPVPDITVRVGRVAAHSLNLRGREIRLAELAEPGTALTLRIGKARLFDFIKGRCIS